MPFVAKNYTSNEGKWVCSRASNLSVSSAKPTASTQNSPDFCGQCVSYVTTVCPSIPVATSKWKKGAKVKGNTNIVEGTAIATFNSNGKYHGHAAIYVSQDKIGVTVWDQWVTKKGKAIGGRVLRWGGTGVSNDGEGFYVIEP
jgi:hypothetical protein